MKKVLVTGSNGYIAKNVVNHFSKNHSVTAINRNDFDLTDTKKTNEFFEQKYFDVVVHTAVVGGNRLIQDVEQNAFKNLLMFENLFRNKHKFTKFINFGSGAEIYFPTTPYGLSKKVINSLIQQFNFTYNLRIFAVFDENENERRFIKSCIKNYIDKRPIVIHQNKKMDFFYMRDLLHVIETYINTDNLPQVYDCVYKQTPTLRYIANYINSLDIHRVDIIENSDVEGENYNGTYNSLFDNLYGLERGIKDTYNKIKAI